MGTVIPSRLWRQMWRFLDDLYQADGDEDSLAILFEGIERLIAYDAAVYIPLDPTSSPSQKF